MWLAPQYSQLLEEEVRVEEFKPQNLRLTPQPRVDHRVTIDQLIKECFNIGSMRTTTRYTYVIFRFSYFLFFFPPSENTMPFFLFSILISDEIQFSTFAVLQGQRSIQSSGFLLSSIFNNWRSSRSNPSTATSRTATTTSNGPFKTSSSESGRKNPIVKEGKRWAKKVSKKIPWQICCHMGTRPWQNSFFLKKKCWF